VECVCVRTSLRSIAAVRLSCPPSARTPPTATGAAAAAAAKAPPCSSSSSSKSPLVRGLTLTLPREGEVEVTAAATAAAAAAVVIGGGLGMDAGDTAEKPGKPVLPVSCSGFVSSSSNSPPVAREGGEEEEEEGIAARPGSANPRGMVGALEEAPAAATGDDDRAQKTRARTPRHTRAPREHTVHNPRT